MLSQSFPVRVNPHALTLEVVKDDFNDWHKTGQLHLYHHALESVRETVGESYKVTATPEEGGTYSITDKRGQTVYMGMPESTFVRLDA